MQLEIIKLRYFNPSLGYFYNLPAISLPLQFHVVFMRLCHRIAIRKRVSYDSYEDRAHIWRHCFNPYRRLQNNQLEQFGARSYEYFRWQKDVRSLLACQLMHSVEFSDYRNQWCFHSVHMYWNRYHRVLKSVLLCYSHSVPKLFKFLLILRKLVIAGFVIEMLCIFENVTSTIKLPAATPSKTSSSRFHS